MNLKVGCRNIKMALCEIAWVIKFHLNPASPKNQTASSVFLFLDCMIQCLPMPCLSVDLGFFNRYTPAIPKNDGNWVMISQA
jgi:hypothetical protein